MHKNMNNKNWGGPLNIYNITWLVRVQIYRPNTDLMSPEPWKSVVSWHSQSVLSHMFCCSSRWNTSYLVVVKNLPAGTALFSALSLRQASDRHQTERSRRTSNPQNGSEKASSSQPWTFSRTPKRLSPKNKISRSLTFDSSANQIFFLGLPSEIHSFSVLY